MANQTQSGMFSALGVGQQTAFKTGVAPSGYVDNVLNINGGAGIQSDMIRQTGSGNPHKTSDVVFRRWAEGSITGNLTANSVVLQNFIASVLGGSVGNNTVLGDDDEGYTHTWTIVGNNSNTLDIDRALTLYKYYGDQTADKLTGCVLNSYKLSCPEAGPVAYECGFFGYEIEVVTLTPTLQPANAPIFSSLHCQMEIGDLGTFANLETIPSFNAFDFEFINNLSQQFAGGKVDSMGMFPLDATITTSTPYESSRKYLDYVNQKIRKSLVITIDTGVAVSDDASSKNYKITLKFPEVAFMESANVDINLEETNPMRQSITMKPSTHNGNTNAYFMEIESIDKTAGTF